eukprot:1897311-Prymnesium_polylepis.1
MGWLLDASRGLPPIRSSRSTDPHRLVAIVFFAATVLPRCRQPRLWPRSPQIRRSLHIYHSLTLSSTRRAALQQPTSEAHNASGWPN